MSLIHPPAVAGTSSRSRSIGREHEQRPETPTSTAQPPDRPDRGWQRVGDVALGVVKAAVVAGAIRGVIPRPLADRVVGSKTLRGA